MLAKIFHSQIIQTERPESFELLLQMLPQVIRNRIETYKTERDYRLRIMGKALLAYAIRDLNLDPDIILPSYKHDLSNKPFFTQPGIHFSISYSIDMVACAVSQGTKIGIDIEKIRPIALHLMRDYFDKGTWKKIIDTTQPNIEFYKQWTIREAALKVSGITIDETELREMEISEQMIRVRDKACYYYCPALAEGFKSCLVSEQELTKIETSRISIDLLH